MIDYALNVAKQLQNSGKIDAAKTIVNSILEAIPTHADALHLLGLIAYQEGAIELSIKLMQDAIASNPKCALFHSNLGEIYRNINNISSSIQCGEEAIRLEPKSPIALSNLGIAYYDAKQYIKAINCHSQALQINPKLYPSLNNMGSIHKSLSNNEETIRFYQAAISAAPHLAEPYNNLGSHYLQQKKFKSAYQYLLKAIQLRPNFASAHCSMGFTLLELNRHDEAWIYFNNALKLKPEYAEAYYGIAKYHSDKQYYHDSEQAIKKAISINPMEVDFYQLFAEICQAQGKNAEAISYLDHAIRLDPSNALLSISKGNAWMETGHFDKAEESFTKIISNPDPEKRILAYYSLSQLRNIKSNHLHFKALLSFANNIQSISEQNHEYIYFALGKYYDDLSEWDNAFRYFKNGCDSKRKIIHYQAEDQVHLTQQLINIFTKERIEYLRNFAHFSKVPIFIIGMPRSGTTLIEQILASHPDVHGGGELTYLNNLIQQSGNKSSRYPENIPHFLPEHYRLIADNYLTYLRQLTPDKPFITDKMPHNFIAIGLIHALFPNAKIIHVKRNPLDTCLSCYTQLFNKGHYYSYDLSELGQYYICYEKIMNHWRNVLPSTAILEINYEDVANNFEFEAKRLLSWCDLNWTSDCLQFYRTNRNITTASFMQARQPIYRTSINRWQRYENQLAPLINILSHPQPNNRHDQNRASQK